ncbi:Putative Dynein light chain 1, cytoplasmic [Rhizopus microsporus]|nr:Putative Dynein light chain 1, cytoplasmic [Rhizopus microsporus]
MLKLIIASIQAILQVMVVVFLGALLARMGYFNMDKQRWLSKLNMVFFTPCLLFSNIASIISFQKLLAFWPIPVFYLIFALMNYTSSNVFSRLVGLSPAYRRFVTACVMFSNSNSVPIAIISSLAVSDAVKTLAWTDDDTSESIAARGISYTLFFAIFGNLIRWSYGYQLLQKRNEDDTSTIHEDEEVQINYKYHSIGNISSSSSASGQSGIINPNESTQLLAQNKQTSNTHPEEDNIVKIIAKRIHGFMSPPLYAAVVALAVGLSPLKPFLYDKQSFLYPSFTKAIESCGKAAVPLILSCLGAQLVGISQSQQAASPEMKKPVTLAIVLRMIIPPFIVVPLLVLFVKYGAQWSSLAGDPVFITMMIVLGCTPTAINLVQITQVNHIFEEEMLRMLFWSYGVVCVPACTLLVFLALSVVDKLL